MPGRSWLIFLGVLETVGVAVIVMGAVALANPDLASSWLQTINAAKSRRVAMDPPRPSAPRPSGAAFATRWRPL